MNNKQTINEAINEFNIARIEFMKQLFKGIGLYKFMKLFNIPVKEKYKL